MKNLIKILSLILLLRLMPIMAMEEDKDFVKSIENQHLDLIAGLPNELWHQILYYVYFYKGILDEQLCNDIYEALDCIKIRVPLIKQNIRLICKNFDSIDASIDKNSLKEELRKFYRYVLIEKFLEVKNDGLYPKGNTWKVNRDTDKKIARFLFNGDIDSGSILRSIMDLMFFGLDNNLGNKIVALLLFYGAHIYDGEEPLLNLAVRTHTSKNNMVKIIKMFLDYGAHVNVKDRYSKTALHAALDLPEVGLMNEIIKTLLDHNADIYVLDNAGKSPRLLAEIGGANLEELQTNANSETSESNLWDNIKNCALM